MAEKRSQKKLTPGIMGVGVLGTAMLTYFQRKNPRPVFYDKYNGLGSLDQIARAGVVFICVPTPFHPKKGFDSSAVEDALKNIPGSKIVVIKSSIVPGTTERLQKQHPQHKIIFNPEFLRQDYSFFDLVHPDRQILGVTAKSRSAAATVMKMLPKAPYEKIMPAAEAEGVKYMANAFLALKVVFANEFYQICQALGIDYNTVKQAVVKDPRIGDSHFDVSYDDYRGYGGSCFPKDVNAIIELAENNKVNAALLKTMRQINRRLLLASGLSENYFLTHTHKKLKKN